MSKNKTRGRVYTRPLGEEENLERESERERESKSKR